jgi:hypothetical protein
MPRQPPRFIPRGFKRREDKSFWTTVAAGLMVAILTNGWQEVHHSQAWVDREAQWQDFANHCFGTRAAK